MPAAGDLSIQERLFPDLTCFGCGPANERGLRLRSFEDGDVVVAAFTPWPEHTNGLGHCNGGIIATVLDCHSAAVVLGEADRRGWRPPDGPGLHYVTAGIDVRYLRPTPLDELQLWGTVVEASEAEIVARTEIRYGAKTRAAADVTWKRWRPRPA
jgi:acyl-coenzyme A thioesterase PaaI-like protein